MMKVRRPGAHWRVFQFLSALLVRGNQDVDGRLQALLGHDALWALLTPLSAFDRAHHLRVHDALIEAGYSQPDLLQAALLHDAGKADNRGRVRLYDRVMKVVLAKTAPGLLMRWSSTPGHRLTHGLYLSVHHANLGAQLAASSGASDRCCELIAMHHERPDTVSDPELLALIQADDGALA